MLSTRIPIGFPELRGLILGVYEWYLTMEGAAWRLRQGPYVEQHLWNAEGIVIRRASHKEDQAARGSAESFSRNITTISDQKEDFRTSCGREDGGEGGEEKGRFQLATP